MICRIYDVPGATRRQYDEVISKLGVPEEAHVHIAGPTKNGWKVVEVWDSEEQADRYMTQGGLAEALQEAQVPEPNITQFEVHNAEWGRA